MGHLLDENGTILENRQAGPGLFLMALRSEKIAQAVLAGQFVHMRVPGMEGHILRRPFSVYAASPSTGTIEILYQTVGFGTRRMAALAPGEAVDMIGPIGSTWRLAYGAGHALLVAGGVGAAPLFMLAEGLVAKGIPVTAVLGAQTKDALVCYGRYGALLSGQAGQAGPGGPALYAATDDGSLGHRGLCTDVAAGLLDAGPYDYVAACGPEAMMRVVAGLAQKASVPCEVSLERRMACGIGACLSCVVETRGGMRRACVDGPVFDAREVVFP